MDSEASSGADLSEQEKSNAGTPEAAAPEKKTAASTATKPLPEVSHTGASIRSFGYDLEANLRGKSADSPERAALPVLGSLLAVTTDDVGEPIPGQEERRASAAASVLQARRFSAIETGGVARATMCSLVAPHIVALLRAAVDTATAFELLWLASNIASGDSAACERLLAAGGLEAVVAVYARLRGAAEGADTATRDAITQICWLISNVAGDSQRAALRVQRVCAPLLRACVYAHGALRKPGDVDTVLWTAQNFIRALAPAAAEGHAGAPSPAEMRLWLDAAVFPLDARLFAARRGVGVPATSLAHLARSPLLPAAAEGDAAAVLALASRTPLNEACAASLGHLLKDVFSYNDISMVRVIGAPLSTGAGDGAQDAARAEACVPLQSLFAFMHLHLSVTGAPPLLRGADTGRAAGALVHAPQAAADNDNDDDSADMQPRGRNASPPGETALLGQSFARLVNAAAERMGLDEHAPPLDRDARAGAAGVYAGAGFVTCRFPAGTTLAEARAAYASAGAGASCFTAEQLAEIAARYAPGDPAECVQLPAPAVEATVRAAMRAVGLADGDFALFDVRCGEPRVVGAPRTLASKADSLISMHVLDRCLDVLTGRSRRMCDAAVQHGLLDVLARALLSCPRRHKHHMFTIFTLCQVLSDAPAHAHAVTRHPGLLTALELALAALPALGYECAREACVLFSLYPTSSQHARFYTHPSMRRVFHALQTVFAHAPPQDGSCAGRERMCCYCVLLTHQLPDAVRAVPGAAGERAAADYARAVPLLHARHIAASPECGQASAMAEACGVAQLLGACAGMRAEDLAAVSAAGTQT